MESDERSDETLIRRKASVSDAGRAAVEPMGVPWRYQAASGGDKGIGYEVGPPRADSDDGDVCQVSYRLDPFDIETAIRSA